MDHLASEIQYSSSDGIQEAYDATADLLYITKLTKLDLLYIADICA